MSNARHIPNLTNEQYHALPQLSRSQHTLLWEDPALFHSQEITHEDDRPEKKAFDTGTVAHACLLEPDDVENVVAIIPVDTFRTAAGGIPAKPLATADCKLWKADNPAEIYQTPAEFAIVERMIRNVHENPDAELLYEHAIEFEHTIAWEDDETGLPLRVRLDMVCRFPQGLYVVDFKTARDISERGFLKEVIARGLHRQAAMYSEGVAELYGEPVIRFPFTLSEKKPAYQCEVRWLDEESIACGHWQNQRIREDFLRRQESGDWRSDTWGTCPKSRLPDWYLREHDAAVLKYNKSLLGE